MKLPGRQGLTLLEVLIAIFVMAVGLLALLALFPLGVLRMNQAIVDDRVAQAARMADAFATAKDLRNDPSVVSAFTNPGGGLPPADPQGPSYPVLIDPVGYLTAGGTTVSKNWVGGKAGTIPRVLPSFVANSQGAIKWFTLLDDIPFAANGTPQILTASTFERNGNFSWAYLVKRPRSSSTIAEMSILVFNRRTLTLSGDLDLFDQLYENTIGFNPAENTITINSTSTPTVRPGDWLLDASYTPSGSYGTANGYLYRVVSIKTQSPTSVEVEVQQRLRNIPSANAKIIVLDGVAEVVERGVGRLP